MAQAKAAVRDAQQTAKAKFEASPEQLGKGGTPGVILGGSDASVKPTAPAPRPVDQPPQRPPPGGEGRSRLLKAKRKAQDDMKD